MFLGALQGFSTEITYDGFRFPVSAQNQISRTHTQVYSTHIQMH